MGTVWKGWTDFFRSLFAVSFGGNALAFAAALKCLRRGDLHLHMVRPPAFLASPPLASYRQPHQMCAEAAAFDI